MIVDEKFSNKGCLAHKWASTEKTIIFPGSSYFEIPNFVFCLLPLILCIVYILSSFGF